MGQEPNIELPAGLLELAAALEAEWPQRITALRVAGVPLNEGDDGSEGEGDSGSEDEGGSEGESGGEGDDSAGKTFDAAYVKKLRDEAAKYRREAKEAKGRAQEYEDQNKTDAQKLEERATAAEQRATAAEGVSMRFEVALDKAPEGMSIVQVRKLAKRLTGKNREELEADAEELFADFAPTNTGASTASGRPRERLRPGAAPSAEEEETDPVKLAAQVPRMYR